MLFIGTPVYDNRVTIQYMHGMMQTMSILQRSGMQVQYSFEQGTYIAVNRERLVRSFLQSTAQCLLLIDADMAFGPQDVLSLLASDVDVISGLYRYRTPVLHGIAEHCFRDLDRKPINLLETSPIIQECLFVPTGMLLIRRSVFETLYEKHEYIFDQGFRNETAAEDSKEQPDPILAAFEGEDIHFSKLWRKAGGKLWVNTAVKVGHIGERDYRMSSCTCMPGSVSHQSDCSHWVLPL